MAYNNKNYRSNNSNNSSNNRSGNNNSGQGGNQKKHSGCSAGRDKNDSPYVRGWNFSKRYGMVTFYACPYGKTKIVTSATGRSWGNWMVRVKTAMGKEFIVGGMHDTNSNMVTVREMGFVMNPKAPNGGYCGRF